MRLISQDGMTDVSYERYTIYACESYGYNKQTKQSEINGYDVKAGADETCLTMGKYSTKEKALKVMYELRNSWKYDLAFFYFPKDEEVEV